MAAIKIDGMKELERKIERLAKWSEKDAQKLRAIDERVAEVYNVALRANIKDSPVDVKVYRSGELRQTIKPGTLRRSIKTFRRSNKAIRWQDQKQAVAARAARLTGKTVGLPPSSRTAAALARRAAQACLSAHRRPHATACSSCATACCVRNLNAG